MGNLYNWNILSILNHSKTRLAHKHRYSKISDIRSLTNLCHMSRLQRNGLKEFAITEFYCNNI